jgi:hypothetical protein
MYGNMLPVSGFGVSTLNVAQHPSNFSNLKMVEVVVSVGSLLIGIASGALVDPHIYSVTGRVLNRVLLL